VYRTQRLLLRVFPGARYVNEYADSHGWPLRAREGDSAKAVETTWDLGPIVTLHCVDDAITGNAHVFVSSEVGNLAEAYLQPAEDQLDIWSLDELLRLVDEAADPQEHGEAILKLAVAAPYESDERVARRFEEAVSSENPLLRDMTVWAMSLCTYPEFRTMLERVAETESQHEVRGRARSLLELYDRHGVPDHAD